MQSPIDPDRQERGPAVSSFFHRCANSIFSLHRSTIHTQARTLIVKKNSPLVIIGLILLALVAGFLIVSNMFMNDRTQPRRSDESTPTAKTDMFREDGTVTFTSAQGLTLGAIVVEIAETDAAREQGLMGRASMQQDRGMLFLFDRPEPRSFWMANTPLPLDILFIDANQRIITIHRNTRPFSEDSLPSSAPAQYVVEVNGGWCDRNGVKEGDAITWRRR